MKKFSGFYSIFCLAVCLAGSSDASWLSKITGIGIDITNPLKPEVSIAAPDIKAIPDMLKNLPKDVGQAMLNPAGSGLAVLIRNSNKQARSSSNPIPQDVRRELLPYFPAQILDKVRYSIYQPGRISLDSAIHYWISREGAVTVDDIIIFSSENVLDDLGLWAHELTHVMQYQNMGVESFANMYTVAFESLEGQARDLSNTVVNKILESRKAGTASQTMYSLSPSAFNQTLPANSFSQAAQNYYPASSCMIISGNWMSNSCPVPVRITDFSYYDFYGRVFWSPCFDNPPYTSCLIPSGYNGPMITPTGGPVAAYNYAYPRF